MSKQWKCKECVKYGTDACYNGSRYEHDNCKYKLIDVDYAYQQGRVDALNDVEKELLKNGFIWTQHAIDIWHNIADRLKEQKNGRD